MGNRMSFFRFNDDGPPKNMVMPRFEEPGTFQFRGEPGDMRFFEGPGAFSMLLGGRSGLQLIEMNTGLGEYFGTSEGLLVTQTPRDSSIPLRSGDVVLTIDGRKPSSVGHALRIIGSYENGETVRAEVMRKRQRVKVEWKVNREAGRVRSLAPSRRPAERERARGDRSRM
jgi:hypothetical protein